MTHARIAGSALAAFLIATVAVASEHPAIRNATLTTQSAATGLDGVLSTLIERQDDEAWVGYEVPLLAGHRMYCGASSHECLCRLESRHQSYSQTSDDDSEESEPSAMTILFRIADNRIDKIRAYSSYCELDAGNLPFIWLDDVRPSESVALLESMTDPSNRSVSHDKDVVDEAITALAFHADPAAQLALERLVEPSRPREVRKQAVFWVGQNSGDRGVETLRKVLHDDPDDKVREGAVFALSCCKNPAALDLLVDVARKDEDPGIRSNALFWLANKAGEKSAEAIADAAKDDPDSDVKERAVFALSQLPREKGVPLLIDVAKSNPSAKVRKQAIFWLGQSNDPRALAFFEDLLTH